MNFNIAKFRSLAASCLLAGVLVAPAQAAPPGVAGKGAASRGEQAVPRKAIRRAVSRGLGYLDSQRGRWQSRCYRYAGGGAEALVALAYLQAGVGPGDSRVASAIGKISLQTPRNGQGIFAVAERVILLARVLHRRADTHNRGQLLGKVQADVNWLAGQQLASGGWGSEAGAKVANTNDTAQVLRAMQAARQLGAKVSQKLYARARGFLKRAQNSDGGFGYHPRGGRPRRLRGTSNGPASAAGALAWAILASQKNQAKPGDGQGYERALNWLARHSSLAKPAEWYWGDEPKYAYLFDLLVATGLGRKLAGKRLDVELARLLMQEQLPSGAWDGNLAEDKIVSTAWAVRTLGRILAGPAGPVSSAAKPSQAGAGGQDNASVPDGPVIFSPGKFKPDRFLVIGRLVGQGGGVADNFARACEKLSDALAGGVSIGAGYRSIVYPAKNKAIPPDVSLVWLTTREPGDVARALSGDALDEYISRGGVVMIDSASGDWANFQAAKAWLGKKFGSDALGRLGPDSPLMTGQFAQGLGNDITSVGYNADLAAMLGASTGRPRLWVVYRSGRVAVVLSRFALAGPATGAAAGQRKIHGYKPIDARRIVINILIYANAGQWKLTEALYSTDLESR